MDAIVVVTSVGSEEQALTIARELDGLARAVFAHVAGPRAD